MLGSGLDAGKSKLSKTQVVLIFRELAVEGSSHKLLVPEAREMNGRAGQISWAWAAHALPLGAASQLQAKAAMLESGLIAPVFRRNQNLNVYVKSVILNVSY